MLKAPTDSNGLVQNPRLNTTENRASNIVPESASADVAQFNLSRHCEMMKTYFLDYYCDMLLYLNERKKRVEETSDYKYEKRLLRKRRTALRLSDFRVLKQIGQGGYGEVYLAEKNDSKELCALKRMNKKHLVRLGEIRHILIERDVLARTNSPWLVKLFYAFQDTLCVYLAMEFVPGGDFRTLLNASGLLREEHAVFYFAEMCESVFALHSLGYIHRDLKPENFLVDVQGHLKLTDFGLSGGALSREVLCYLQEKLDMVKRETLEVQTTSQRFNTFQTIRRDTRAFSLVGSPDYMAPEVLTKSGEGYTSAVDYWSLGCILFEMLSGYPPFTASTTNKVWKNLYNWKTVLERPIYKDEDADFNLSDKSWALIIKLVCEDEVRIQTPHDLKSDPFFCNLDFSQLRSQGSTPPWKPILKSVTDTAHFDDFNDPKDMQMYQEIKQKQLELSIGQQRIPNVPPSAFIGFTFKHKD